MEIMGIILLWIGRCFLVLLCIPGILVLTGWIFFVLKERKEHRQFKNSDCSYCSCHQGSEKKSNDFSVEQTTQNER